MPLDDLLGHSLMLGKLFGQLDNKEDGWEVHPPLGYEL